jgi:hypothetical protein
MKITVEISDSELKDICRFTGEKKKGPAIRKMVVDSLMLRRRAALAQNFITGKWSAEFEGIEESRKADRERSRKREAAWR